MFPRIVASLLSGLVATALQASPQVYKWVDAKGVVNYSNAPPPGAASSVKAVEERISVIGADPSVAQAAAAMREREARRAEYEEREWQRRQNALLTQQQASAATYCAFGPDCGLSYYPEIYYPYFAPAYGYRVGGGRVSGRWRPHAARHVHKGPSFAARGGTAYAGPRGGAYASVRAGSYSGRGASR
jgi:hypothetical protein